MVVVCEILAAQAADAWNPPRVAGSECRITWFVFPLAQQAVQIVRLGYAAKDTARGNKG